ncbi:MAG: pentapeptide repeat-containing protein [Rhizomicrobium sp.]
MFASLALVLGLGASSAALPVQLVPVEYISPDRGAVASIRAGNHDCPHCDLAGADLTNTCVKGGNLEGAKFDGARAVLMCMSYADFKGASFRKTDLAGANLAHADVDDADFTDADLSITSIKGTDLSHARGLTQAQLDRACGDAETKAPAGLTVKTCS